MPRHSKLNEPPFQSVWCAMQLGKKYVVSLFASFRVHAMIKILCWADSCLAEAKLASPKLAKQSSDIGIGRTITEVFANSWISLSTRFASSRVCAVALVIPFCRCATFAATSGRECTAAYWWLPQIPLSLFNSWGVVGLSISALRGLGMSMSAILWTYLSWLTLIEKIWQLFYFKSCETKFPFLMRAERKLFLKLLQGMAKFFGYPPPNRHPREYPLVIIPLRTFGFLGSLNKYKQLSKGCAVNPTSS